ncbi:hypothetical protein AB0K51_17145 [Kitasatospora sp. NPDC049285]|uniref:hypothetical protein n=1 Tax=Kitasatospora sp. NPDC049285 TaxID=3157096 RepID=UPI0034154EC3
MLTELLRALHAGWAGVWALLDDASRRKLVELLADPGDDPVRTARSVQRLLKRALPSGHPLWEPAADSDSARFVDGAEDTPEALRAALLRLVGSLPITTGELSERAPESADEWLLRASWTEAQCRSAGADPSGPDLIRLTDRQGAVVLPRFQFDRVSGAALSAVLAVNRLLDADEDPWGVADWWLGGNAWLAGVPAELLGTERESSLLSAARAELADW